MTAMGRQPPFGAGLLRRQGRAGRSPLPPPALGEFGQTVRIVFGLEPGGGGAGLRFEIVAARGGLRSAPFREIGVGVGGLGAHRRGVDRSDERLRKFALGAVASRFDDHLARNVAPVENGQVGHASPALLALAAISGWRRAARSATAPTDDRRNLSIPPSPVKRRSKARPSRRAAASALSVMAGSSV